MIVIDVTEIKDDIQGFAGVCYPMEDNNGRFILAEDSLTDSLLAEIYEQIEACPRIPYISKQLDELI